LADINVFGKRQFMKTILRRQGRISAKTKSPAQNERETEDEFGFHG